MQRHRPWRAQFFALVPVAPTLLLVTGLGTPVALAAMSVVGALGLLAWALEARAVGHQPRVWTHRGGGPSPGAETRFGRTLLGSAVFFLIPWVPFPGFLFSAVLFLAALGILAEALRACHWRR